MSGSGKADNGRVNNRRHSFKRRNNSGEEGFDPLLTNGNSHNNNNPKQFQKPHGKKSRGKWQEPSANQKPEEARQGAPLTARGSPAETSRSEKPPLVDRPKWVPQRINSNPLPVPDCPYCGKPIRDISQAVSDKDTGVPVHFDCIVSRITSGETLEKDDSVSYIGGGRFGIVSFKGRNDFKIKRIIEWENKDKRAEWRSEICEHYSVI